MNIQNAQRDLTHYLAYYTFELIFFNENSCIVIQMKFVSKYLIDNNPALVQIMTWHQSGDKPLSEKMMTEFTDISASLGLNELTNDSHFFNDEN